MLVSKGTACPCGRVKLQSANASLENKAMNKGASRMGPMILMSRGCPQDLLIFLGGIFNESSISELLERACHIQPASWTATPNDPPAAQSMHVLDRRAGSVPRSDTWHQLTSEHSCTAACCCSLLNIRDSSLQAGCSRPILLGFQQAVGKLAERIGTAGCINTRATALPQDELLPSTHPASSTTCPWLVCLRRSLCRHQNELTLGVAQFVTRPVLPACPRCVGPGPRL